MKRRSTYALRAIGLAAALTAWLGSAHADPAQLDINLEFNPTSGTPTLTPIDIIVKVNNRSTRQGTSRNAPVSLELPSHLSDLQFQGAVGNGAQCAVQDPAPPDGVTGAGQKIEWVIAALPESKECVYTFRATPLLPTQYFFKATVEGGPNDEPAGQSVEATSTYTVQQAKKVKLQLEKKILSVDGAAPTPVDVSLGLGNKAFEGVYDKPIKYQLRFSNLSDVALNLGDLNDYWDDWEYPTSVGNVGNAQFTPRTSETKNAICKVEGGANPRSKCPDPAHVRASASTEGSDLRPIEVERQHMKDVVLAAGETMVLEYERIYQEAECDRPLLRNQIKWLVNTYNTNPSLQVEWENDSQGIDEVLLLLPEGTQSQCKAITLDLHAEKHLVAINDVDIPSNHQQGAPVRLPDPGPGQQATATYKVTVVNRHTQEQEDFFAANPNHPQNFVFNLYDVYRTFDKRTAPTFYPAGSVVQKIQVREATCKKLAHGTTPASDTICSWLHNDQDINPASSQQGTRPWEAPRSAEGTPLWDQIALGLNEQVELLIDVHYKHKDAAQPALCREQLNTMVNTLNVEVKKRKGPNNPDEFLAFKGTTNIYGGDYDPNAQHGTNTSNRPLELFGDLPRCAQMSTQKTAEQDPADHHAVTFKLQFENATQAGDAGVNPLKNVTLRDPLPASFKVTPGGVSCTADAGVQMPAVGDAHIIDESGQKVFQVIVDSIPKGEKINCTIKGRDLLPGTHSNTSSVRIDPYNGAGGAGPATHINPNPDIEASTANYTIKGRLVRLEKKLVESITGPGGTIKWQVTAHNPSTSEVNGKLIDTLPAGFARFQWQCDAGASGGSCQNAAGQSQGQVTGAPLELDARIPAGATVTLQITGYLPSNTLPTTEVVNSVQLSGLPQDVGCLKPREPSSNETTPPPCKDEVSAHATLVALSKTALPAGTTSYTPGSEVKFAVEVRNLSTTSQATVRLQDALPAGTTVMSWECMDQASNACGNGAGALDLPALVLAPDARQTYTVTVQVPAGFTGNLENIARLTPPADGFCQVAGGIQPAGQACEAPVSLTPGALPPPPASVLRITKTTSSTQLTPGGTAQFTVQVQNTGTTAVNAVQFNDALPAGIASQAWTCAAAPAGSCSSAAGNGAIDLTLDLPAGATATIAITATAEAANLPAQVVNTARITPPAGATCDPATTCEASAQVPTSTGPGPIPSNGVVAVSKTASSTSVAAGGKITFDIVVSASGGRDSHGVRIQDPLAAGIASQTWRCTAATGGASCPTPDQGSGALNAVLTQLPSGGQVRFQIEATTDAALPVGSQVINVATLSDLPSNVDCDPTTGCSARNAAVPVIAAPSPTGTVPVPVGAPWMLALLALCMAGLARRQRR